MKHTKVVAAVLSSLLFAFAAGGCTRSADGKIDPVGFEKDTYTNLSADGNFGVSNSVDNSASIAENDITSESEAENLGMGGTSSSGDDITSESEADISDMGGTSSSDDDITSESEAENSGMGGTSPSDDEITPEKLPVTADAESKEGVSAEMYAESGADVPAGGTVAENELFTCVTEDGLARLALGEATAGRTVHYGWKQNTPTKKGSDSGKITFTAKRTIELTVYLAYTDAEYRSYFSQGEYRYIAAGEEYSFAMAEEKKEGTIVVQLRAGETLSVQARYERSRGGYLWLLGAVAREIF
jgi:hypothetical protein